MCSTQKTASQSYLDGWDRVFGGGNNGGDEGAGGSSLDAESKDRRWLVQSTLMVVEQHIDVLNDMLFAAKSRGIGIDLVVNHGYCYEDPEKVEIAGHFVDR